MQNKRNLGFYREHYITGIVLTIIYLNRQFNNTSRLSAYWYVWTNKAALSLIIRCDNTTDKNQY